MRHAVKGRKLKVTSSHKKALFSNLATSLLRQKRIKTTVAKAKELRTFVEKLITKAKRQDIAARRHVARFIHDRAVVKELFDEIIAKIGDRPGGYTRVVKLGSRRGDGADLALIELVDYNEGVIKTPKLKESKKAEQKVVEQKETKTESNEPLTEASDKSETLSKKTQKIEDITAEDQKEENK